MDPGARGRSAAYKEIDENSRLRHESVRLRCARYTPSIALSPQAQVLCCHGDGRPEGCCVGCEAGCQGNWSRDLGDVSFFPLQQVLCQSHEAMRQASRYSIGCLTSGSSTTPWAISLCALHARAEHPPRSSPRRSAVHFQPPLRRRVRSDTRGYAARRSGLLLRK